MRCLAAPLRRTLFAAGSVVPHWNILYDAKEKDSTAGDVSLLWDKSSYLNDKEWLKSEYNPLLNSPFLVDVEKNMVITQTLAISRYLGTELGMFGNSERDSIRCDELLHELIDLSGIMTGFAYGTDDSEKAARVCLEQADGSFQKLEVQLKLNSNSGICLHLVGNSFTTPDFHLYELLDQFHGLSTHYKVQPHFLDSYPYLSKFNVNLGKLPPVSSYNISILNQGLPYNNPYACFGSDPVTRKYARGQAAPWRRQGNINLSY